MTVIVQKRMFCLLTMSIVNHGTLTIHQCWLTCFVGGSFWHALTHVQASRKPRTADLGPRAVIIWWPWARHQASPVVNNQWFIRSHKLVTGQLVLGDGLLLVVYKLVNKLSNCRLMVIHH